MKTLTKIKYIVLSAFAVATTACEEKELLPSDSYSQPPLPPVNVIVQPKAGGATLTYTMPADESVLGVKAVYTISNGTEIKKTASLYSNQIVIDGYIDENVHEIKLTSFNRAMQESEPVTVSFTPLKSALKSAAESMVIDRDFGGAQFTWKNEDRQILNLELLTTDSLGRIVPMKILTTQTPNGCQSLRGYDTTPRWFAAIFKDNYDNASDTIFPTDKDGNKVMLSPLYEEKLDKKLMRVMVLDNDQSFTKEGSNEALIDDDINTHGHTEYQNCLPAAVTLDLGQTAKISRIVVHARPVNGSYFEWGNPRIFEVFTTDRTPDKSGDWSQWTKIMDCTVERPSGTPAGTPDTDEDHEAGIAGADFSVPLETSPMRYLRLNVLKVWTSNTFCHIAEISVYGDPNI